MSIKGKEIMALLEQAVAANTDAAVFLLPEGGEFQSTLRDWQRMGNSGQVHLAELVPQEGNLKLIPGDSRLRVVFNFKRRVYQFESLLMRLEQDSGEVVLRMPEKVLQPQRRSNSRVEAQNDEQIVFRFPAELQQEIPRTRAAAGKGEKFSEIDDPRVVDISQNGLSFQTNFRMDRFVRGDVIEQAELRLPAGHELQCALKIEHIRLLDAGHYRFRAGCSITYVSPPEAERKIQEYVRQRQGDGIAAR